MIALNEIVDGSNKTRHRTVVSCELHSFETPYPYENREEYNEAITCDDNETALFAFDRFETFNENDYLTMTNNDNVVIYSECYLRRHLLDTFFRYIGQVWRQLFSISHLAQQWNIGI